LLLGEPGHGKSRLLTELMGEADRAGARVADAGGLLRRHQGAYGEAAELFRQASILARVQGDRANEFLALEHLVTMELEQRHLPEAQALCRELRILAGKLREGSEAPFARALEALCRCTQGVRAAEAELAAELDALRIADAKHRLAFLLATAAELDLSRGRIAQAKFRAEQALHNATLLGLASDAAISRAILLRAALLMGDEVNHRRHKDALRSALMQPISARARAMSESALGEAEAPSGLRDEKNEPRARRFDESADGQGE
jgi:hypothetical protein